MTLKDKNLFFNFYFWKFTIARNLLKNNTRSSRAELFCKKADLKSLAKYTWKHLPWSRILADFPTFADSVNKGLNRRCYPVNFEKFIRVAFLQNSSERLLQFRRKKTPADRSCSIMRILNRSFVIGSWFFIDMWKIRLFISFLYEESRLNPLSANITKWSNTLKQFVRKLPTNRLSVFDHFVILTLKGLSSPKRANKVGKIYGLHMEIIYLVRMQSFAEKQFCLTLWYVHIHFFKVRWKTVEPYQSTSLHYLWFWLWIHWLHKLIIACILFLNPLNPTENLWFSEVFRGYRNGILG